ncbi:D-alanine--D-alanine ligase [bacterium]|nr:D-alanine--D-alanine ligase [bacterium]
MTKPRIAVLIGGPSREHDVSRSSARNILAAIDEHRYDVRPILITHQGEWRVYSSELGLEADTPQQVWGQTQIQVLLPYEVDAAFIAMHGEFGEDGTIQRLLDRATIPYQGSGPRSSALAFDKAASYATLRRQGFSIPDYVVMSRAEWVANRFKRMRQIVTALGADVVVKPVAAGSSVGVYLVHTPAQLADALEQVSVEFDRFIIQKFVRGEEVTCGVLETDEGLVALPPTLIRPRSSHFFDYTAKYTVGASEEITPAPLHPSLIAVIQRVALAVHRALKCRDYSRSDFILTRNKLWLLELNTLPGMTETSLVPQAAAAYGMGFSELVHHLIERARNRPEVIELH